MLYAAKMIRREVKDSVALGFPLLMAWIIYSLSPFIGIVMIAKLGKDALAASILVTMIWGAGITFCFGIFHSVSVLVSQQLGAKNFEAISEVMGQAFFLNILLWVPLISLMLFVPYLVHWSLPSKEVILYVAQYAHALILAVPGLITLVIFEHFLSGIGRTKMSLWISLWEIPLEIFLMYIFVFGKLGIPAFGIAGVGYGLAFSFSITTVGLLIFLHYAPFMRPFNIYQYLGNFNWHYCKEMLRIGLPVGLSYFIELLTFTVATYFISRFNTTMLAAHQIVMQFLNIVITIPYALSQSVSIRVGQFVGCQNKEGVWYASYVGLGICIFSAMIIFFILLLFPKLLLSIDFDVNDPKNNLLTHEAVSLFLILSVYQLVDTIRIAELGALRGLKDTRYPMLVTLISFFGVGLIIAYFLGIVLNYEAEGVWVGLTSGMILGMLLLFIRLKKIIKNADLLTVLSISQRI